MSRVDDLINAEENHLVSAFILSPKDWFWRWNSSYPRKMFREGLQPSDYPSIFIIHEIAESNAYDEILKRYYEAFAENVFENSGVYEKHWPDLSFEEFKTWFDTTYTSTICNVY